ncbi:MAG TPA: hypothetical protein VME47_03855 [Acetobacteraceae bacterium]|nr:hypothetical protein [Acetobacteraceae bacterium]
MPRQARRFGQERQPAFTIERQVTQCRRRRHRRSIEFQPIDHRLNAAANDFAAFEFFLAPLGKMVFQARPLDARLRGDEEWRVRFLAPDIAAAQQAHEQVGLDMVLRDAGVLAVHNPAEQADGLAPEMGLPDCQVSHA